MGNLLGIDLGGTKVALVLASPSGRFLFERTYPSPFRRTGGQTADGAPEVLADNPADPEVADLPLDQRIYAYLHRIESDFLHRARRAAGTDAYEKKGLSLCGRTWVHDGRVFMIGGNTPSRFASDLGDGRIGIAVADDTPDTVAANDGNAAATAQGIFYSAERGIAPDQSGYLILGTGLGFGVPGYFAMTELGHMPVGFMPQELWQACGCRQGQKTACAENYAAGRGIAQTARLLLEAAAADRLNSVSVCLDPLLAGRDLAELAAASSLPEIPDPDAAAVMRLAGEQTDGLAMFVADLAAEVTAYAIVSAAYMFGLRIVGIGERVALENPWHVENIARKVNSCLVGATLLRPPLEVAATALKDPAKYGALSLVVPASEYGNWAAKMAGADPGRRM